MVNPGSFQGARKEFLFGEKAAYKAAVLGGYARDALAKIQCRFFKRFPIDLPLDVNPTTEELAAIDDDTPDDEDEAPDAEKMTPEDFVAAIKAFEEHRRLVHFRKEQIKRWLAYQHMKDEELDPRDTGVQNPYHILLSQLTGGSIGKPRQKTAMNIWRRTHTNELEAELKRRASEVGVDRKRLAALRESVAKNMFSTLDETEKEEWRQRAKDEHISDLDAWNKARSGEPSTAPADRQRSIQALTKFVQPILDGICSVTGWKATFIAGGPEPADDGRINVLSIHSGTTTGPVRMTFGRAERDTYKKHVLDSYGRFLKKCYTKEECLARALRKDEGFGILNDSGDVDIHGISLDTDEPTSSHVTEGNGADSTMACDHLPSTNVQISDGYRSPTCQPPVNRNPSPAFISPNPSRAPSPVVKDTHTQLDPPSTSVDDQHAVPADSSAQLGPPISASVDDQRPAVLLDNQPALTSNLTSPSDATPPPEQIVAAPSVPVQRLRQTTAKRVREASPSESEEEASSRPKKQLRMVVPPSEAPDWFLEVFDMLEVTDLGSSWIGLLKLWSALEKQESYSGAGKLSAKKRPEVVGQWIARRRSVTWRPIISDLTAFEKQFNEWWLAIQPGWRVSDGMLLFDVVEGDWEPLRLTGKNGLVSVLAALFYWGLAVRANSRRKKAWSAAVEDCRIVFQQLLS